MCRQAISADVPTDVAADPVEWTENGHRRKVRRTAVAEGLLSALNAYLAGTNLAEGDPGFMVFAFFMVYFAGRSVGHGWAVRAAPLATFAGWSHARFRFRDREESYAYPDIVAVKGKTALFRGGAVLRLVLRDGEEVRVFGIEPARCATLERVIRAQRRALRGEVGAAAGASAAYSHAVSRFPDGRQERDLTTSQRLAEGWPMGLGRWSYSDPDLTRGMARLLYVGYFLIPIFLLQKPGSGGGAALVIGAPIGLLLAFAIYVFFLQEEHGDRGDYWLRLPPTIHTSASIEALVRAACRSGGLPVPERAGSNIRSTWRIARGLKVSLHTTTWGEPNTLAVSHTPAAELAAAQGLKGALLDAIERPWATMSNGAVGPDLDTTTATGGPAWAKAILPSPSEPVGDVHLPDDDPGHAPAGWWASSVRRPALASSKTTGTRALAALILGSGSLLVAAGFVLAPSDSITGSALLFCGLLVMAIFILVWFGQELTEALTARHRRDQSARCYLRIDPGTRSAEDVVEAVGAAICLPWPWVRRLAPPRAALAYWSDSDGESQVVLWSGSGLGLPVLELRSQRPGDEVAKLKGAMLAALYPDG